MADDAGQGLGLGGEDSPWAHDVPASPAPALPDSWTRQEPLPIATPLRAFASAIPSHDDRGELDDRDIASDHLLDNQPEHGRIERHRRPWLIAAAVVSIGLGIVVTSTLVGGSDSGGDANAPARSATSTLAPTTRADDDGGARSVTVRPATEAASSVARTTVPAALPEPARQWVTTSITLSPRLQAMTVPTQVVVLNSDGILHVIDIPTGVLRSIDTRIGGSTLALVVGDDAIAVSSYNGKDITIVNPGGSAYDVAVAGGAGDMMARFGTNDFVVTPNEWPNNEQPNGMLVAADGTWAQITEGPLDEYGIWGLRYLRATGEAVVNDSGGTYAIDAAGSARRLSSGDLMAVGDNHVLVRECDETLICAYTRIDGRSGERLMVTAPDLDEYRGYDPSLSLSPDGSMTTYFDWVSTPLSRRLIDFDTGTSEIVDSIDQYNNNSAWAADSSGLFIIDDRELVLYDKVSGERIEVAPGADLGAIVAVAARSVTG